MQSMAKGVAVQGESTEAPSVGNGETGPLAIFERGPFLVSCWQPRT
jgi:hypothetical protein